MLDVLWVRFFLGARESVYGCPYVGRFGELVDDFAAEDSWIVERELVVSELFIIHEVLD